MENISSYQYTVLIGALALSVITFAILVFVIYRQQRKIKYLTTPRYGFMGKSLAVVAVMLIGVGTFSAIYLRPPQMPKNISITDRNDIVLDIKYLVVDEPLNLYKLNVIPKINNRAWGESGQVFTVSWGINKAGKTTLRSEQISKDNPGGIQEYLEEGVNTIFVNVSVGFIEKTQTIDILVD